MSFFESHNQQNQKQPGTGNILQQFQQFQQSFKGDPQQVLQQLISSGKVSQQQIDQAMQMARQLRQMIGK